MIWLHLLNADGTCDYEAIASFFCFLSSFVRTVHARGLELRQDGSVSGWPPCGQKRGRGCGGGAPGAMATHENGRHQYRERATRKGESSRFFDNAVILLLELSAFASWVESESVYPIPPYLKSFVRGIFTPEGSLALWSACSNYLGVGTPSYYSLLLILTDKYINCKGTPETPYIVAFGSITELSEITV